MFDTIIAGIFTVAALFFALVPHEIAHGYTAYLMGDNTAKYQGRLSLNPFKHINPKYATLIFAGVFLGKILPMLNFLTDLCIWIGFVLLLKPVPINPGYFRDPKKGMAITALMGPVTNLVMGFLSIIIFAYTYRFMYVRTFFQMLAIYNVQLAVFNLIPVPPLDGSRVLFAFLPQKYYFQIMQYERYIMIGFLILVWSGLLSNLIMNGTNNILNIFQMIIPILPGI